MVQEIIFHLGDCKTGTTSIQTVLARRQWESPGQSVLYTARFNHIPLANSLNTPGLRQKRMVSELVRALKASDAKTAIISAEFFEFLPPEKLHAFVTDALAPWKDNIRLVAYVRPHAERFLSSFAERSKKGGCRDGLDEFHTQILKEKLLYYTPRFAAHRDLFGARFMLRPFIRDHLRGGDVVDDFFHIALNGAPVSYPNRSDENESLSLEDLVLMRLIQKQVQKHGSKMQDARKALGWNFGPMLATQPAAQSSKLKLHRPLAEELVKTYAEDAAALDAMFFDGTPMSDRLTAAPKAALDAPQSLNPADYHSPEVLRVAKATAQFYARLMSADPAHFKWAGRPADFRSEKMPRATLGIDPVATPRLQSLKDRIMGRVSGRRPSRD